MEKAIAVFKLVTLLCGTATMFHRIITAPKETEVQRLCKDVNALMFFVIYLVLASLTK